MFLDWIFNSRGRTLSQPLSKQRSLWIADNVWHWHVLNEVQRQRLGGLVQIFVKEKTFEGCAGLVVSDEMKFTIAAAACTLLIGFSDTYCFDRAKTLLIYPRPMVQRNLRKAGGIVDPEPWVAGMASQGGTIVLSWKDVINDGRDEGSVGNVVIHEFAHHVDGIDGAMEGIPPLPSQELREQWKKVASRELQNLREAAASGQPTVLDTYGGENLTELFAVATEAFFCNGQNLFDHHRELYDLLAILYQLDTKGWFR